MDDGSPKWLKLFDERQQKEIEFNRIYAMSFHHGTEGHNARLIMARLAEMLDKAEASGVDFHKLLSPKVDDAQ